MHKYDFSSLNSQDFEELVADLLNAKYESEQTAVRFRVFKEGKDRGIDLLHSTETFDLAIVGQVKHYLKSGVNTLLRHLETKEVPKVKKLKPQSYLLATSVELSASNLFAIHKLFAPYIKDTNNIWDAVALNKLLADFPEVMRKHFKLWFSTTETLQHILNFQSEGRSAEFTENYLKRRLRLYVKTSALQQAINILEQHKYVIITGEPGTGKTTTAELLLYLKIAEGFKLIYIYDDIKEAEPSLNDENRKCIYYFDDFLGQTAIEIQKAKGAETALLKVLNRVRRSNNKYFVFTTRSFILNGAIQESERLRALNLDRRQTTVTLDHYNNEKRQQMFLNHIEESELTDDYKEVLKEKTFINFITKHKNFSPRSVEFITSKEHIEGIDAGKFADFIKINFDSPERIWKHAYEQQISDIERLLLNSMVSFGRAVSGNELETAFYGRLDYEVRTNNFIKPLHAFKKAVARLEGGFLETETYNDNKWKFINPSLVDFLVQQIQSEKEEGKRIADAAIYLDQLIARLYMLDPLQSNVKLEGLIAQRILDDPSQFINPYSNAERVRLMLLLHYYLAHPRCEKLISIQFKEVDDWDEVLRISDLSYLLLQWLKSPLPPKIKLIIRNAGNEMFAAFVHRSNRLDYIIEVLVLADDSFGVQLMEDKDLNVDIQQHCTELLEQKIDDDIEDLLQLEFADDYVGERKSNAHKFKHELEALGMEIKVNISAYDRYDWFEVGQNNHFRMLMEKDND